MENNWAPPVMDRGVARLPKIRDHLYNLRNDEQHTRAASFEFQLQLWYTPCQTQVWLPPHCTACSALLATCACIAYPCTRFAYPPMGTPSAPLSSAPQIALLRFACSVPVALQHITVHYSLSMLMLHYCLPVLMYITVCLCSVRYRLSMPMLHYIAACIMLQLAYYVTLPLAFAHAT